MRGEQAGGRTRAHRVALLVLGLGPGVIGRKAYGAADGLVLSFQLLVEESLGGGVGGDALEEQEGDQALLESAGAAFDLSFGLRARGDPMGDPQGGEGALELRAGISSVGGGPVAEDGQPIGVEGQRAAVPEESGAEVLEMVPGGVGGDEGAADVSPRVVVDGEKECLLVVGRPPGMDGGVVLPEFADAGPFPSAPGLGHRGQCPDLIGKVAPGMSGDGLAVALEGEAGRQFIGDPLVVGRPLQGQEGPQEALDLDRPALVMVAA